MTFGIFFMSVDKNDNMYVYKNMTYLPSGSCEILCTCCLAAARYDVTDCKIQCTTVSRLKYIMQLSNGCKILCTYCLVFARYYVHTFCLTAARYGVTDS